MELKGKAIEKLTKEDRVKKEETLKRMEDTRKKYDILFLEKVKNKLNWLISEHKNSKLEYDKMRDRIVKIEGAIEILQDLLKE